MSLSVRRYDGDEARYFEACRRAAGSVTSYCGPDKMAAAVAEQRLFRSFASLSSMTELSSLYGLDEDVSIGGSAGRYLQGTSADRELYCSISANLALF